jgi:hypothetical protein
MELSLCGQGLAIAAHVAHRLALWKTSKRTGSSCGKRKVCAQTSAGEAQLQTPRDVLAAAGQLGVAILYPGAFAFLHVLSHGRF